MHKFKIKECFMILKLFLIVVSVVSLSAKESSWYDNIEVKVEAGMHLADFGGTHSNSATGYTDYVDDFGYSDAASSYFGLEFDFNYDYIPDIDINYFNVKQTQNATLDANKTVEVAAKYEFTNAISSKIDYEVLNVIFHKEMKRKGKRVSFLRWRPYLGDIAFAVGLNVKIVRWHFRITDDPSPTQPVYKFVNVDEYIPLPYIKFKYFLYNLTVFGNVSALSLVDAKSTNYEVGIEYRVMKDLYLVGSYMYEDFKAVEKKDTIDFKTTGNKFSFKYVF